MLDLFYGFLVIVTSFAIVAPLVWWLMKDEQFTTDVIDATTADTQVIRRPDPHPETVNTEVLIVDCRPIPDEPTPLVDELGEWKPWEHTMEQPHLLVNVLLASQWHTLDNTKLGLVAA